SESDEVRVFIEQKLFEAPNYFENVPLQITFMDTDWNTFSITENSSGSHQEIVANVPFEPVMVYLNKESQLLNAVTGENFTVTEPTTIPSSYAYFNFTVEEEEDYSFLSIEHYRLAPDNLQNSYAGHEFVISPNRYWKIDGIISNSFKAKGRLFYN